MPCHKTLILIFTFITVFQFSSYSQFRKIHDEAADPENEIVSISFYSGSEGFVAFRKWIGFTSDSGRTYEKKFIRIDNVDFNGKNVNLTFGFGISAIKAFNQNNIVISGDYGMVPAILTSSDGGNNFVLRFHSQFDRWNITGGITDMIFTSGETGFAVDADRVLKTTDSGISWTPVFTRSRSFFTNIVSPDGQHIYTYSREYGFAQMFKSSDGGGGWNEVNLPAIANRRIYSSWFLAENLGWLSLGDNDNNLYFYNTTNGGVNWNMINDPVATPFGSNKFRFVDNNVGYALGGLFSVFKTIDGGKVWEPLSRDNSFEYLLHGHNDLFLFSPNQIWAGGGAGLLEITTNGGGNTLPKAYFKTDTAGVADHGKVQLLNYSKSGHNFSWYVNGKLISADFNSTYLHDEQHTQDTVMLVASDGFVNDTAIKYYQFPPPLKLLSFSPQAAGAGTLVTITAADVFDEITSISFGGVPAPEYFRVTSTQVQARVGAGATGSVRVNTRTVSGSLPGFIFLPAPTVTNFSPKKVTAGTTVTITGSHFSDVQSVLFGGTPATSFTVLSPTQIKAVVPSGPSGSISVVTPGGKSEATGFVSQPTIESYTPTQGTQGTIMTITGTSLTDIDRITIGRIPVDSFTVHAHNLITAIVGPGKSGNVVTFKKSDSASRPGFKWFAAPVISDFSPSSGPVNTTVTISGKNFNPGASGNIVYFGDVKAKVLSASSTSISVQVPPGASFEPISVVSNSLIALSMRPFSVTHSGGGSITDASFKDTMWVQTGKNFNNMDVAGSDIDGDGYTDLILSRYNRDGIPFSGIAILRNLSGGDELVFDTAHIILGNYVMLKTADMNNDGMQDILVSGEGTLSIYLNQSQPGSIRLSSPVVLHSVPDNFEVNDIDYDGKLDILYVGGFYSDLQVYRNISEPGSVVFETRSDVLGEALGAFRIVDLNADGRLELVTGGKVFKNTSTVGKISFQHAADWSALQFPPYGSGDIDNDGKPEIISYSIASSLVAVFRNTSSDDSFGFAEAILLPCTEMPRSITLNDMDGDGRADIVVTLYNNSIGVYKNTGSKGLISFSQKIDYLPGIYNGTRSQAVADLNNDGRFEVITFGELIEGLTIHRNSVKSEPVVLSISPGIATEGSIITITGENFVDVKSVKFGDSEATSFTVVSPTRIQATVAAGSTGDVIVTNSWGTGKLPGFSFGIPPVISGLSSVTAEVGSILTITGNNFAPDINSNTVFFGNVPAQIVSATENSIRVKVPASPASERISVTSNGLTAFAPVFFSVLFPGADNNITSSSFEPKIDRENSGSGIMADLDGDFRPEMLTIGNNNDIQIAKNLSDPGHISFAQNIRINVGDGIVGKGIAAGDIDGDGKLDIVTSHVGGSLIRIFKNTGTADNFALQEVWKYNSGYSYAGPPMAIVDVDLDGRPDIITISYQQRMVSVFRNESSNGQVKMGERIGYSLNDYPNDLKVADLDNDGKPELILACGGILIMKNTSEPGKILFGMNLNLAGGNWPVALDISDLDGDRKPDLALLNANSYDVHLYLNISSGDEMQFEKGPVLQTTGTANDIRIGDLDGDGYRDIVVQTLENYFVNIYKNKSERGKLSFLQAMNIRQVNGSNVTFIEDVDTDGLPDIVSFSSYYWSSILRNRIGLSTPVKYCNRGDVKMETTITGANYQWQMLNAGMYENIKDGEDYEGSNNRVLTLKNIPASGNGSLYRCLVDGNGDRPFRLDSIGTMKLPAIYTTVTDTAICAGTEIEFSTYYNNAGEQPKIEWMVDNQVTGITENIFRTSMLADSAEVNIRLIATGNCLVKDTVYSDVKRISVTGWTAPTVSVSASANNICKGTRVDFTPNFTHGGTQPAFHWLKNGQEVNLTDMIYADAYIADGDVIAVKLISNAKCLTAVEAISQPIVMYVRELVIPQISISAGSSVLVLGQTAKVTADTSFAGVNAIFEWQDSTAVHGWQKINYANGTSMDYMPASTGDHVRCIMTSTASCASPGQVHSNALVFEVKDPGRKVQVMPNPVMATLTLVVDLADRWETVDILDMQGRIEQAHINVFNQSKINVDVARLKPGIYLAVLRNSKGDLEKIRFMKN